MVVSALNRKLWRDLAALKVQMASVALVVGVGIAVLFGFTSTYASLEASRESFYHETNFADGSIAVKNAPLNIVRNLLEIPGVIEVEPRITAEVMLGVEGFAEPASATMISIPNGKQPSINRLIIKQGRLPNASENTEVVVNEGFFNFHRLALGSVLSATLNGKREILRVVGVATSPEYTIAIQPGTPLPDDGHYAVIWVNSDLLQRAFGMRAAFNNAVMTFASGSNETAILGAIERSLKRFGTLGAIPRSKQIAHFHLNEELNQLRVMATSLPVLFFIVGAFILSVVITRLVQAQRSDIATLKAIGYYDGQIAVHYFSIAIIIVVFGAAIGLGIGTWIGMAMTKLYSFYYRLPLISFKFSFPQLGLSLAISLITAAIGTFSALKSIFKLAPAEAMRPPVPIGFHSGWIENTGIFLNLSTRTRMSLRGIYAAPGRSLLTIFGLSLAIVLLVSGLFWADSMNFLIDVQYGLVQRESGSVQLVKPVALSSVNEILKLDGVVAAEGNRIVPVKIRLRSKEQQTSLRGMPVPSHLQGIITKDLQEIKLPQNGLVVSSILASQLNAREGDTLEIEFTEGRQIIQNLPVNKIIDTFMTNEILLDRALLARLLGERETVNQILFRTIGHPQTLYVNLKDLPTVLSVTFKESALSTFRKSSAQYMLVFAFLLSVFAGTIGFGIAYNNMQVTYVERDWELATLRILGFHVPEAFRILIMEFTSLLFLCIPVGWGLGYLNARWLMSQMAVESFQLPFILSQRTLVIAAVILLISSAISGLVIWRRVRLMDLIATLKTRS